MAGSKCSKPGYLVPAEVSATPLADGPYVMVGGGRDGSGLCARKGRAVVGWAGWLWQKFRLRRAANKPRLVSVLASPCKLHVTQARGSQCAVAKKKCLPRESSADNTNVLRGPWKVGE
jgi:hypothetical protein